MNRKIDLSRCEILLGLIVSLALLGCSKPGPASAQVEGTVTLNGTPLPNAELAFYPTEGRASQGITGEDGRYVLTFTYDTPGCIPGNHQVMITTRRPESDEQGAAYLPELVPKKYRKRGELTATVETGRNVVNFDLTN